MQSPVVRRPLAFHILTTFPEPLNRFTQNLVGSIGAISNQKSKMAAMVDILKIYFSLLLLNQKAK